MCCDNTELHHTDPSHVFKDLLYSILTIRSIVIFSYSQHLHIFVAFLLNSSSIFLWVLSFLLERMSINTKEGKIISFFKLFYYKKGEMCKIRGEVLKLKAVILYAYSQICLL